MSATENCWRAELRFFYDVFLGAPMTRVTLVAIAKNEERYLLEWIAYHLAIGYDNIVIYDNESSDNSERMVTSLKEDFPVDLIKWPSVPRFSPQRSAYKDAISKAEPSSWISFLDIDEFIVPWGFQSIKDYLESAPAGAASLAINWLGFGSSGYQSAIYSSVIKTFTRCSEPSWANNRHFKTIARVGLVDEAHIHDVSIKSGKKLASDFSELVLDGEGKNKTPIYGGIQINHYQVKTWQEFSERMSRGNANFPPGHPNHGRDGSKDRFESLDRNEREDLRIAQFFDKHDAMLATMKLAIQKRS